MPMPFSVQAETVAATTIVVKLTTLKNVKANDGNGNDKHQQRQRQWQQWQSSTTTATVTATQRQ